MPETIHCPGCDSQLVLPPVPAGQTVKCPRCERAFEPASVKATVVPPRSRSLTADEHEVEVPIPPTRLLRPLPLREGKATLAMVMLALSVLSIGIPWYLFEERSELDRIRRQIGPVRRRIVELDLRQEEFDRLAHLGTLTYLTINIVTGICFVTWLVGASKNLRILQAEGRTSSPTQDAFGFLIPLMNLFVAYFVVQEIWRGSDPHIERQNRQLWLTGRRSLTIRLWWVAYLGAVVFASTRNDGSFDPFAIIGLLTFFVPGCFGPAGILLIHIIRSITLRQRERFIRLYEDPA